LIQKKKPNKNDFSSKVFNLKATHTLFGVNQNPKTKMEIHNHIWSFIFIIAFNEIEIEGRRIGGGGSIFSKPKTPFRPPTSNSRPGAGAPIYSRPVLGRNYGGFTGRRSTSGSGFGLGEISKFLNFNNTVLIFRY
jgi:hypothetical protein